MYSSYVMYVPGMPWVGWALGEGLALARGWVGRARPLEPVAHHISENERSRYTLDLDVALFTTYC